MQNLNYQKVFSVTELSSKQQKAIVLLAAGELKKDTAKTVGITPQTISLWLRDLEFQASLNALKMEQLETARTALQAMTKEATQTLAEVMRKADSYETRHRAALDVLEIVGLAGDPSHFGWGVGPSTADELEREEERRQKLQLLGF